MNVLKIILFLSVIVSAQAESYLDLSLFKNGDNPILNISFYSDNGDIQYKLVQNSYIAKIDFQIIVNDLNHNTIDTLIWKYSSQIDTTKLNSQNVVIAENKLNLKSNNTYLIICNAIYENKYLVSQSVNLNTIVDSSVSMSDILLVYDVAENNNNSKSEFVRNNYVVTPNASNSIYGTEPRLQTYQEIYNLGKYINNNILIKYSILDGTHKEVISQSKKTKVSYANFLDILDLNLFEISTGTYYLSISILDSNEKNIFTKSKLFFLLNPATKPSIQGLFRESRAFEESVFSSMTDGELDLEFSKFKLILSEYEIDQFNKLIDYKAKRRAIYKYWYIRDSDTITTLNEKREEFLNRVKTAERLFGNGIENSGWKSERGKIMLKYGIATVRNINQREGDRVECEEWFYDDLGGGLFFYFVQRFALNNFVLVHSNASGEPRDPNWLQNYNPNIQSDGTSKFRNNNQR